MTDIFLYFALCMAAIFIVVFLRKWFNGKPRRLVAEPVVAPPELDVEEDVPYEQELEEQHGESNLPWRFYPGGILQPRTRPSMEPWDCPAVDEMQPWDYHPGIRRRPQASVPRVLRPSAIRTMCTWPLHEARTRIFYRNPDFTTDSCHRTN